MEIVAAQKRLGKVEGVFIADGAGFETRSLPELELGFDGIAGDRHGGALRQSGGREPWYPRGTEMRNERQLTILSVEELAAVAVDMNIEALEAEWIGGNLLLLGIAHLSLLPPRTLLMFEGGVTVRVDGDNGPCRFAGKAIADHCPGRDDLELGFPKLAKKRRGLVGWVEKPGTIVAGEKVTVRIPEQWIYPG